MVIAKVRGVLTAAWLAVATAVLGSCGGQSITFNVTRTLVQDGRFQELSRALVSTGLDATLANESQTFTLFAPTDAAFAALGTEVATALATDPDLLRALLLNHMLLGAELDSAAVMASAGGRLATASGGEIALGLRGGELYINDARLSIADIQASNGVIHAIDAVLIPGEPAYGLGTVAELLATDPRLGTLAIFMDFTGFISLFEDERGSFTLFAPSDAAFAALPPDLAQQLATDPELLVSVLMNHFVVNQTLDAETLAAFAGESVRLESGWRASLAQDEQGLSIGSARVQEADIPADNGVIHIIDAVLMP